MRADPPPAAVTQTAPSPLHASSPCPPRFLKIRRDNARKPPPSRHKQPAERTRLIQTCELNEVNPFDYLKELHRHAAEASLNPEAWPPWNYRETLATASPETTAVPAASTC